MEDFRDLARGLLPAPVDEERFAFCGQDAENYICAYCGTDTIPEGCQTLAARMLAAAYDGEAAGNVKSISRGDTNVTFSDSAPERFSSFDLRLNAFRKLKWS